MFHSLPMSSPLVTLPLLLLTACLPPAPHVSTVSESVTAAPTEELPELPPKPQWQPSHLPPNIVALSEETPCPLREDVESEPVPCATAQYTRDLTTGICLIAITWKDNSFWGDKKFPSRSFTAISCDVIPRAFSADTDAPEKNHDVAP